MMEYDHMIKSFSFADAFTLQTSPNHTPSREREREREREMMMMMMMIDYFIKRDTHQCVYECVRIRLS